MLILTHFPSFEDSGTGCPEKMWIPGFEQLGLVEGVPADCRGAGLDGL